MSALPPKADMCGAIAHVRFWANSGHLLNDFVSEQQERFRDRQTKPFGGLQVHNQTELCRQLNREVGRICAAQDAINVRSRFTHGLQLVNSVRNQSTARDIKTE